MPRMLCRRWYMGHLVLLHMSRHGILARVAVIAPIWHHVVSSTFTAEEVGTIRPMRGKGVVAILLVEGYHAIAGAIASHVVRCMVCCRVSSLSMTRATIVGLVSLLGLGIAPAVMAAIVGVVIHVGWWVGCVGRRWRLLLSPVVDGDNPLMTASRPAPRIVDTFVAG